MPYLENKIKITQLKVINHIVETCSKETLDNIFASIVDLPKHSTKAEMISHCFNKELGAYGFESYVASDKTSVLINDDTMCHVVDFFKEKGFQPYITKE